jgi:general secretion pathway protein B
MSYILDALRKSDQMRQRGATPTLASVPLPVPAASRSRRLRNGVVAAALIGAGVVLGWLQPWVSRPPADSSAAGVVRDAGDASRVAVVPMEVSPARPDDALDAGLEPAVEPSSPAPETPTAADGNAVAPVVASGLPAPTARREEIPTLSELPASMRGEIPAISIAFHAYSTSPAERRVMINGAMAGEGDTLAGGLVLESITRDGVVLAYRGSRFRHPVR